MSELVKRSIFGSLYIVVILAGILFSSVYTFALTALFIAIGYRELRKMFTGDFQVYYTPVLSAFILWAYSFRALVNNGDLHQLGMVMVIGLFLILIEHVWTVNSEKSTGRLGNSLLAFIYLGIPSALAPWLTHLEGSFNYTPLLGLFVLLWCNDSFAYLVGKSIGKHPLHKRLSPKKSIEGFVGGLIFAGIAAYIFSITTTSALSTFDWFAFALFAAVGGTLGDLFESSLKRAAGVKDSGDFIPGHGGILDRIDSFLFMVPLAWLYLWIQ